MAVELNHTIVPAHDPQASAQFLALSRRAVMRRRARIMRAVNVPMRAVLSLPFATPLSGNLMLISYTGRKSGKAYGSRSATCATATCCSPRAAAAGRSTWPTGGRPGSGCAAATRPPGRTAYQPIPPSLERLLGVIAEKNPRAARFVHPAPPPTGRLDPDALDAALQHGFCIMRWHLAEQG